MNLADFEIINEPNDKKQRLLAVELASTGKTDMVMKGLVDTATFFKKCIK